MSHWTHPLLVNDHDFNEVWARPADDRLLVVVGSGFDPRAVTVLDRLHMAASRPIDGLMIELPQDSTDAAVRPLALDNRTRIETLIKKSNGEFRMQPLPEYSDARSLGRLISRHFQATSILDQYREVLIDISAMPRSVFFPLVRGILERAHLVTTNRLHWAGDLHVAVCENPEIDGRVFEEGSTPMEPIGGFAGPIMRPTTTIWVPVIGERASARVRTLYEALEPDETCPVLPWPARDPRRGDRLLLEYRRLLFEEIRIEPRNIIHASERNPFDLYRTLGALYERYRQSLSALGPVRMVLSTHSSKLLSVGILLTAYEYELMVQHVSPTSYGLRDGVEDLLDSSEIYDLWLTGEPYR